MKPWILAFLIVLALAGLFSIAGCGNVTLSGDAATAAEASTLDAYQALQRARSTSQPAEPSWVAVYLEENFKQWRSFVQSNRKDLTWGPRLDSEKVATPTPTGGQ